METGLTKTNQNLALLKQQPKAYIQALKPTSFKDVISTGEISIRAVKAEISLEKTRALLFDCLTDYLMLLNVGKPMGGKQAIGCVDLILSLHQDITLSDFKLCMQRLIAGEYGKLYDKIDANTVLSAIREYKLEKEDYAVNHHNELHKKFKSDSIVHSEKLTKEEEEKFAALREKYLPELISSFKPVDQLGTIEVERVPNLEKTVHDPIKEKINEWIKEFEKKCETKGQDIGGVLFLKVDGKMMDKREYLEYKFNSLN